MQPPRAEDNEFDGEKMLFCGWRRDMAHIVLALDDMVPKGTELHIL